MANPKWKVILPAFGSSLLHTSVSACFGDKQCGLHSGWLLNSGGGQRRISDAIVQDCKSQSKGWPYISAVPATAVRLLEQEFPGRLREPRSLYLIMFNSGAELPSAPTSTTLAVFGAISAWIVWLVFTRCFSHGDEPPEVPSAIPWLGHAVPFIRDRNVFMEWVRLVVPPPSSLSFLF